mmetsp:Transcript_35531/g.73979  ORF Transcript_35531/g.73979 Transcript_35531/m.73979 type:complete len:97 (+) Transcript_35531:247-537(+)
MGGSGEPSTRNVDCRSHRRSINRLSRSNGRPWLLPLLWWKDKNISATTNGSEDDQVGRVDQGAFTMALRIGSLLWIRERPHHCFHVFGVHRGEQLR